MNSPGYVMPWERDDGYENMLQSGMKSLMNDNLQILRAADLF